MKVGKKCRVGKKGPSNGLLDGKEGERSTKEVEAKSMKKTLFSLFFLFFPLSPPTHVFWTVFVCAREGVGKKKEGSDGPK